MTESLKSGIRDLVGQNFAEEKRKARGHYCADSIWSAYNSPVECYQRFFGPVLNGMKIEDLVSHTKNPIVIDLMAPSGTLADLSLRLRSEGFMGISIGLDDLRTKEEMERNTQLGVIHISGDITKPSPWREVKKLLNGRKADLIMERALGGIINLPTHRAFYCIALQRMWNILAENGTLLFELPEAEALFDAEVSPTAWVNLLRKKKVDTAFDKVQGAIMIRKASDSPDTLPVSSEVMVAEDVTLPLANYFQFWKRPEKIGNYPNNSKDPGKIRNQEIFKIRPITQNKQFPY